MKLTVNGSVEESEARNLAEFVISRQLEVDALVVEHNSRIVPRDEWEAVELVEGDSVEMLRFVGGG